jgi:hypothetical protein
VRVAPQWLDTRAARYKDHIWRKRYQFRRVFAGLLFIAAGPTVVDLDILPDGPTQLL